MTGVRVGVDSLAGPGGALVRLGGTLAEDVAAFEATLRTAGRPWGTDRFGRVIDEVVAQVIESALLHLPLVAAEIRDCGDDLRADQEARQLVERGNRRYLDEVSTGEAGGGPT